MTEQFATFATTRRFFGEVVEEYEAKGTDDFTDLPTSSYVFGNGKRIMSISATGEKTYYLSDILGSNSLLTDNDGEATMLTKYDEFGNTYYEWSLTSNLQPLNTSTLESPLTVKLDCTITAQGTIISHGGDG
ncbi:hypothetical protein KAU32_13190 [bacterium]|nr:hypothetical protein [bacterium]